MTWITISHGMYFINGVSFYLYQLETLKLSIGTITIMTGVVSLPWCIKFLFG